MDLTIVRESFNCFKLTASVSLVPLPRLVILLPPMLRLPPVTEMSPALKFNAGPFSLFLIELIPLRSLFNLTVNVSLPSATTLMLPAADWNAVD